MLQASLSDCQFFDFLPFPEYGFVPSEVDVGRCDVVQALVVSFVVVVVDECPDLAFEITGKVVVFQQNPVLHGLVPALDLALGLEGGMVRRERDPSSCRSNHSARSPEM